MTLAPAGEDGTDAIRLEEIRWLDSPENVDVIHEFENIYYTKQGTGELVSGDLEVVRLTGDGGVFVREVEYVDQIAKNFPLIKSISNDWNHLNLTYEYVDDYVRVLSPSGVEIGKFVKEGGDEIFEIGDDFFTATGSGGTTPISGITVKTSSGEIITGAGFVQNGNTINFVENATSYGNELVQNAIKNRGILRQNIPGILPGQEAHHIIPVQLLKENDVVKKAVEGGFNFNSIDNGMALDKYSSKTGLGRHGPHPNYTNQIRQALDDWSEVTPNFTTQQAKEFLDIITSEIRNTINSTSGRINMLDLGL
ncbi:MAG: AHH domain-containing protein [Crocinitomicaceae bacterium]|nr:AHH domain-containing protein [Crocinitomicaceae bacterium]MBK8926591.1 AHH domain-containing protein [Crocinitomicaceae bacterium]